MDSISMGNQPKPRRNTALRQHPGYMAWFMSDTAESLGSTLQDFAIALVAYSVSGSLITAGLIPTVTRIARQVANIFGGTVVDRHNRRLLTICNAATGALAWGCAGVLLATSELSFPALLVISVICALSNGLFGGATDAMLRSIVDTRDYPKARSLNEGRDAVIGMIGNPVSGALYSICSWVPFIASSVMYGVSGICAAMLRPSSSAGRRRTGNHYATSSQQNRISSFFVDFIDGWCFVLTQHVLMLFIIVTAFMNFSMNTIQYGIELYLVGEHTQPMLLAMIGPAECIGMLIGSMIANRCSTSAPAGLCICISVIVIAVAYLPLCFTTAYPVILVCSIIIGLPFPLYNAMVMGLIFTATPEYLQGRVKSAVSFGVQTMSMFSSAIAGYLVARTGLCRTTLALVPILAMCATMILSNRRIREIPASEQWTASMQ